METQPLLPLSEITFYILLSLAPGRKHGYAILKEVETLSRESVKLSTSSLYDGLTRLLQQALIERVETENDLANGRARKYYALSDLGRRTLAAEAQRMKRLVDLSRPYSEEGVL